MSLLTKGLMMLIFFSLLMGVVAFLPDYTFPEIIRTALQFIIDNSFWTNRYLPVDTGLQVFGSMLATLFVLWIWENGKSIIRSAASIFS